MAADTDTGGEPPARPSALTRQERLYGYIVAAELVVVSILNLTDTHGKDAPAHPDTTMALIGLVASFAFAGSLQMKNRFVAGFGAIIAAFFVTLPKTPQSVTVYHIFALVLPLIYALVLTQRQSRAVKAQARAARASGTPRREPARRGRRRRGKDDDEQPRHPKPNSRYTPPKAKADPKGRGRR